MLGGPCCHLANQDSVWFCPWAVNPWSQLFLFAELHFFICKMGINQSTYYWDLKGPNQWRPSFPPTFWINWNTWQNNRVDEKLDVPFFSDKAGTKENGCYYILLILRCTFFSHLPTFNWTCISQSMASYNCCWPDGGHDKVVGAYTHMNLGYSWWQDQATEPPDVSVNKLLKTI